MYLGILLFFEGCSPRTWTVGSSKIDQSVDATPQKMYRFDYLASYDYNISEVDSVTERRLVLSSSNNPNYYIEVSEKDSLTYTADFFDQDKIYSTFSLPKEYFVRAKSIKLECKSVLVNRNYHKFQTENYAFSRMGDTLLAGDSFARYKFSNVALPEKVLKRKKIGTNYYIVENDTEFHLPLFKHPTAYEEYKKEGNVPNGILKSLYFVRYGTTDKQFVYILRAYKKINLVLQIEDGCDFYSTKQ